MYRGIKRTACEKSGGLLRNFYWCGTTPDYDKDRKWSECATSFSAALGARKGAGVQASSYTFRTASITKDLLKSAYAPAMVGECAKYGMKPVCDDAQHCSLQYAMMARGRCATSRQFITTGQECEIAAQNLGLADTTVSRTNSSSSPHGCFFGRRKGRWYLYFNVGGVKTSNFTNGRSLCRDGKNNKTLYLGHRGSLVAAVRASWLPSGLAAIRSYWYGVCSYQGGGGALCSPKLTKGQTSLGKPRLYKVATVANNRGFICGVRDPTGEAQTQLAGVVRAGPFSAPDASCVDKDARCVSRAAKTPSECSVNPKYMLTHCAKSCHACTGTFTFRTTRLTSTKGSYSSLMISECKKYGMKPVCDYPGYCKNDKAALYIGQSGYLAYSPHRNNKHRMPSGFADIAFNWEQRCSYTGTSRKAYARCEVRQNWLSSRSAKTYWKLPAQYNNGFICGVLDPARTILAALQGVVMWYPNQCMLQCEADSRCSHYVAHGGTCTVYGLGLARNSTPAGWLAGAAKTAATGGARWTRTGGTCKAIDLGGGKRAYCHSAAALGLPRCGPSGMFCSAC